MRLVWGLVLTAGALTAASIGAAPSVSGDVVRVTPLDAPQQGQVIDVTLSGSGSHPKIGLPTFFTGGGSATLQETAKTLADVLAFDLEFEREFYIIPRTTSASIPVVGTPDALPTDRWSALGADFVLLGSVQEAGGVLSVKVGLYPVKSGPKPWGPMAYDGCTTANVRYCAHSIADDMHRAIRGVEGIARTKIAFTSDRALTRMEGRPTSGASAGKEIYIMDYDGANPRPATANRSLNLHPNWSPDGKYLAYTTYAPGYPDIYLASLFEARSPMRPAAGNSDAQNSFPAISPDGTRIAFASTRPGGGNMDIWVVNRDGSGLKNLTPNTKNSYESVPTWSPGGNQIAFTSDRSGSNQIYTMNSTDGLNPRRMTTADAKTDRPRWAPAPFDYIAFVTGGDRIHDVAVLDLSTMQSRILTDGASANDSPTISPNGRHIVFVTSRWGNNNELAVIDYPDGKNLRRLTNVGNNSYPSWSPSPGR